MEINVSAEAPEAAAAIAGLDAGKLPLIEDETFDGRIIFLDGRAWKNCTFRNCRIVARLGWFHLEGVIFEPGNVLEPSGLVQRSHELVDAISRVGRFRPTRGRGN